MLVKVNGVKLNAEIDKIMCLRHIQSNMFVAVDLFDISSV